MLMMAVLATVTTPVPAQPSAAPIPRRIEKIIAKADGLSAASAFKVASVGEEYQVLHALKLRHRSQALVIQKRRPYDVITAIDETGAERKIWFDISRFYPMF
jgi:hypothetical protein